LFKLPNSFGFSFATFFLEPSYEFLQSQSQFPLLDKRLYVSTQGSKELLLRIVFTRNREGNHILKITYNKYHFVAKLVHLSLVKKVEAEKKENHNMADNNISLGLLLDQHYVQLTQLVMELGGTPPPVSSGISFILHVAYHDGNLPHLPLLDFLLERDDITRIDKIDALEMAGAVILAHDENHEKFPLAYQYWRRALTLRLLDTEDSRPIYKTPLKSKSGQLSEWSTLDDLQRIEQQPAQRKIQSFLVRLRILSAQSWHAVNYYFIRFFFDFIRNELSNDGSMSEMLELCWITFDVFLHSDRPHESSLQEVITDIAAEFVRTFRLLEKGDPKLNSENLMKLVEVVLMSDPSYMTDPKFETPIAAISHMEFMGVMFMVLSRHPEMITEEGRLSLLQLVHRDGRDEDGVMEIAFCTSPAVYLAVPKLCPPSTSSSNSEQI